MVVYRRQPSSLNSWYMSKKWVFIKPETTVNDNVKLKPPQQQVETNGKLNSHYSDPIMATHEYETFIRVVKNHCC